MASEKWEWSHTVLGTIVLICLISVFKNPFIYFEDYSVALGLSNFEYSIILLSLYAGNITSLFFGVYVNNLFKDKYQGIASVFSGISGALALLFCVIIYFDKGAGAVGETDKSHISIFIVVYGSIVAFLYKNAASICYATVVGLANEWSASNKKGANISYLQLSWSISTLLYIPIGFLLEYLFWYIPFMIFGVVLILYAFILNWGFTFKHHAPAQPVQIQSGGVGGPVSEQDESVLKSVSDIASNFTNLTQEVTANFGDLKTVFNKQINLILCAIFFCSIAQGSFLITTSSFWMEDVYLLDTSSVGFVTLSVFLAEVIGSIIMTQISDTYGIFVCSFIAFIIEIIASLIILNLSIIIGPDIGGLPYAIILNFFLFVGWEIFFITQVLAMIEFGPVNVSKNIILLSNFAVASIAKMIGAELSSLLWNDGQGLQILAAIWLIANSLGLACYSILYQIKDKRAQTGSSDGEYLPIRDAGYSDSNANPIL